GSKDNKRECGVIALMPVWVVVLVVARVVALTIVLLVVQMVVLEVVLVIVLVVVLLVMLVSMALQPGASSIPSGASEGGHIGSMLSTTWDLKDYREFDSRLITLGDTPPTFIWASEGDMTVPVENTKRYVAALVSAGVSHEAHIFPNGKH
ncbi:unnamed protein product, partial [Prorocentrum cordatum]